MSAGERPVPRATYRLQFNKSFGFRDAAALAPYLAELGISHVYASPYFKARPGSTHGYDVVDHNALNLELGSDADFAAMCEAFRAHRLSQILDFVPNHMGIGGADNPFWLDVLEWGPESRYADWFDIEWEPEQRYLHHKVLVPFLGSQYGLALQEGALALKADRDEGSFAVWAYDMHKLPVCPLHYGEILAAEHPDFERIGDGFAHLAASRRDVARRAGELKAELAALLGDVSLRSALETCVARCNGIPGDLESWSRLDALIRKQFWRPAHFRVAADDINYRRFFNINDLAGIRMEVPEVFEHLHRLVFRLIGDGLVDGLRLDHVDGLTDPKAYCLRLREAAPRPIYLVVEKILASHESLRDDWEVDGTTGYEFANLVTGLMLDPAGEAPLARAYAAFAGVETAFEEIVRTSKLQIMDDEMASELNVLARETARVARSHPLTADFTSNVLRRALKQIIACFPVYRTYVDRSGATDADRRDIDWALAKARRLDTALDPSVFDFLHQLMTLDLGARPRSGFSRAAILGAAMRVQQYSGPVMAKGLEDTTFYRFNRLLALNEVGGSPDRFGVSVAQFHAANLQRAGRTPHALLGTSTHDTKRGEDARARLAVLSEIPDEWGEQLPLWSRMLRARHAGTLEAIPPVPNDEYAFYQLLLAAWPPALSATSGPAALSEFSARIETVMLKCMREAKVRTTWAAPDAAYEDAVLDFVRHALDGSRSNAFLESFVPFAGKVAHLALSNSLVQATLKLTVPGVPDIYQGAELLDLSLVDPDNRRPVDFGERRRMLTGIRQGKAQPNEPPVLAEDAGGDERKLRLLAELLRLRREHEALFAFGTYEALTVAGSEADRVCAFARTRDDAVLAVAVLLFPSRGTIANGTTIAVPDSPRTRRWRSILDGRTFRAADGILEASALFEKLPVAVLVAIEEA